MVLLDASISQGHPQGGLYRGTKDQHILSNICSNWLIMQHCVLEFLEMFILVKTKRRPLYLKPQSVPRCKHFSSVIKTNQFML